MANTQSAADAGQVNLAVENPAAPEPDLSRPDDPVGSVPSETSAEGTSEDSPTSDADPTPSGTPSSSTDASVPPSSKPAEPPVPPTRPQVTEEEQVITLVNASRAQSGCGPVRVVGELADAAQGHSTDMADRDYFDHTTPEGVGFAERIVEAGYPSPGAENIARGQTSATQVMNSWMDSDGHRANILNCQLKTIGVGLDKDGWYWTQNFGY